MEIPAKPPELHEIFLKNNDFANYSLLFEILEKTGPVDSEGRYLHWDQMKHLEPPENLTNEQWWAGTKHHRRNHYIKLPLEDKLGQAFNFCVTDSILEELHWLDKQITCKISTDQAVSKPNICKTCLLKSLLEVLIHSGPSEASTTRNMAKKMIRQGRKPKDKSEQMILNHYHAMQFIKNSQDQKLTPAILYELHKILTKKTLDDPDKAGVLRKEKDEICIIDKYTSEIMYKPPETNSLEDRIDALCSFANGESASRFIHPVVRAIILHFILAYDHPFVDGNGRTARALFYWSMIRHGYWFAEHLSISKIMEYSRIPYARAFLYTETDDNDVTYFIIHQLEVIRKAITDLHSEKDA